MTQTTEEIKFGNDQTTVTFPFYLRYQRTSMIRTKKNGECRKIIFVGR